jgi:hypothetical protein
LKESKVVGDEVCHCIRDVENNGVIRMLRLIALKVNFLIDIGQNLAFSSYVHIMLLDSDSYNLIMTLI